MNIIQGIRDYLRLETLKSTQSVRLFKRVYPLNSIGFYPHYTFVSIKFGSHWGWLALLFLQRRNQTKAHEGNQIPHSQHWKSNALPNDLRLSSRVLTNMPSGSKYLGCLKLFIMLHMVCSTCISLRGSNHKVLVFMYFPGRGLGIVIYRKDREK